MGTLHIILNIVLILASAALVDSVLMQKTKSSGLGSAFGSDTASFNTARNKAVSKEAKLQGLTPDQVETNYAKATPIRRVLQPDEIADAVVFLCSDKASFITGHALAVDGGYLAR